MWWCYVYYCIYMLFLSVLEPRFLCTSLLFAPRRQMATTLNYYMRGLCHTIYSIECKMVHTDHTNIPAIVAFVFSWDGKCIHIYGHKVRELLRVEQMFSTICLNVICLPFDSREKRSGLWSTTLWPFVWEKNQQFIQKLWVFKIQKKKTTWPDGALNNRPYLLRLITPSNLWATWTFCARN